MKIESVRIENFRSFKDETIYFDDYTCFVGANGCGKSTILNALNIFFRQNKDCATDLCRLSIEDFHHKNINEPIKITVTFIELSDKAKEDLSDYVRQDKLIVSSIAKYDNNKNIAEVKHYGNRLGFCDFREYFEADKNGKTVEDLKSIYLNLQQKYNDLPNASTKIKMAQSLQEYETNNKERCVPIKSEDQFYGFTKGQNRIAPYVQWIFVPAVKDVTKESQETKDTALGQLLARTVRSKANFTEKINNLKKDTQEQYQKILNKEQSILDEISNNLKIKLESWAHSGTSAKILWKQDPEKSVRVEEPFAHIKVGERGFEGDLTRFGHGLQRSFILALLQELTTINDETSPKLIMGIEEPEIYQHPPQVRHLAETLLELSEKDSQIMVCSHNPLFVRGDNFESIRLVREKGSPSESYISRISYDSLSYELAKAQHGKKVLKEKGMLAKLYPSLNPVINEMFFCNNLILTEGIEDVAYISTYLLLTDNMEVFRQYGGHIVPAGRKSEIIKPLAIAKLLNLPVFVVCDADTDKENDEIQMHKKDNKSILSLLGYDHLNEWPKNNIYENNLTMWNKNITEVIKTEFNGKWEKFKTIANSFYGEPGGLSKNPLAIAFALEKAWKEGLISHELMNLINRIISFIKG